MSNGEVIIIPFFLSSGLIPLFVMFAFWKIYFYARRRQGF